VAKFMTFVGNAKTLVNGLAASTGATDASKLVETDASGKLDPSLMPVGVGAATQSIVASEALTAGNLVNIFDNAGTPNVRRADASNGRAANGFVLASFASAANALVYKTGSITGVTGLTAGTPYFLAATPGGVTATRPTAVGQIVQEVGYAETATSLLFEFDAPTIIA
jgi:hypothetical protein